MHAQQIHAQIEHHQRKLDHFLMSKAGKSGCTYDDVDDRINDEQRAIDNYTSSLQLQADVEAQRLQGLHP